MNVKVVSTSDSKVAAQQWIKSNWQGRCAHMYATVFDQANQGHCIFHDQPCATAGVIDCLMSGFPCQAWTRLRGAAKATTPPSDHWGWAVTFSDAMMILDKFTVLGGIAEQVLGFADADHYSDPAALEGCASPFKLFIKYLESRGFSHVTLRLNMNAWLSYPPRDRLYTFYASEAIGGIAAIRFFEATVKDCFELQFVRQTILSGSLRLVGNGGVGFLAGGNCFALVLMRRVVFCILGSRRPSSL
jgi:hypothetical protein